MGFLIWRKKDILFSRYLEFCALSEVTNFKIFDVIIDISSLTLSVFFVRTLGSLIKKFGQLLVPIKPNISFVFRTELVPSPFIIVIKWQYNAIFKFLLDNVCYFSSFQRTFSED